MTTLERQVLNEIQKGIPLIESPFQLIGEKLGISEDDVLDIIASLKEKDYIRRFGGILDVNKLGIKSTLVAMKVDESEIEYVASLINEYRSVTHNYERDDDYNLWFTIMEKTQEEVEARIAEIKNKTKIDEIMYLPAIHKYKTNVFFSFK